MHPTKTLDPDGMPTLFYQNFWHIIGDSVAKTMLQILKLGHFRLSFNNIHITFIPKNDRVAKLSDLSPISLCNVICKLISKVITNRLKLILLNIISKSQSPFVPGRQITNDILIAYELHYFLRRQKKGKQGYMWIKLDMSNAYAQVECTI